MLSQIIISTNLETRVNKINDILALQNQEQIINSPDVLYIKAEEKLGIAKVREIINHLSTKPYQAQGKMVILENASTLTTDAQNALLKTLEEPPETALLVLGVNSENDLLPTILSRCEIINLQSNPVILSETKGISPVLYPSAMPQDDKYKNDIQNLINSTVSERFTYIEKFKEKDEFLQALIFFWRQQLLKNPTKENKNFTEELMQAEKWAKSNVNIRAILEYLMLVMPGSHM